MAFLPHPTSLILVQYRLLLCKESSLGMRLHLLLFHREFPNKSNTLFSGPFCRHRLSYYCELPFHTHCIHTYKKAYRVRQMSGSDNPQCHVQTPYLIKNIYIFRLLPLSLNYILTKYIFSCQFPSCREALQLGERGQQSNSLSQLYNYYTHVILMKMQPMTMTMTTVLDR